MNTNKKNRRSAIQRYFPLQCEYNLVNWAIYWTLGSFLKPLATIILPKSPTLSGTFCKGVKIYHLSREIILGNFYRHLAIFFWSHWAPAQTWLTRSICARTKGGSNQVSFIRGTIQKVWQQQHQIKRREKKFCSLINFFMYELLIS